MRKKIIALAWLTGTALPVFSTAAVFSDLSVLDFELSAKQHDVLTYPNGQVIAVMGTTTLVFADNSSADLNR